MSLDLSAIRRDFSILEERVPDPWGGSNPLRYFDHAASTHAPDPVIASVSTFLRTAYANVHRAPHHLSRRATDALEASRVRVGAFVGAPAGYETTFVLNTTQALNLASHVARHARPGSRVLVSGLEHHSNILPHRAAAAETVATRPDGHLDMDDLETRLRSHPRPGVLAITCASNVTGIRPPVREIQERARDAGCLTLLDGAQVLGHEPVDLAALGSPDLFAAAGHKAYAPFGSAFVVAREDLLKAAPPWMPGGGVVRHVGLDDTVWTDAAERHEGGTPNVAGAFAMARAMDYLERVGMDRMRERESRLLDRLLSGLGEIDGVHILGDASPKSRIGVVSFVLDGWTPSAAATALDAEFGIAVRHGRFCAHPYAAALGLDDGRFASAVHAGRPVTGPGIPGGLRASLGVYTSPDEDEGLLAGLQALAARPPDDGWSWDPATESWTPSGDAVPMAQR